MNLNLLRSVKFTELKAGDKLLSITNYEVITMYKAPKFAVLKHNDGNESCHSQSILERAFKLQPLCWVEGKPVYPGDTLYYKCIPAWKYNEEGVIAASVRNGSLYFKDDQVFPIDTATWVKPQSERAPSFQVEGRDVFPGDTVYYYGSRRSRWGITMTVENGRRVVEHGFACIVDDYNMGSESFRLKPQLLIGDRLVPMPEREAPAMGRNFFIANPYGENYYSKYLWSGDESELLWLERGLVHLTTEAAAAHGEALAALSKKKD